MHTPDLSNCDLEPIHIPGKIQSHGFLLAIDSFFNISFCSENISEFLPVTAGQILNNSIIILESYFEKKPDPDFFNHVIREIKEQSEIRNPYLLKANGQDFNLIISTSGEYYIFEFEPEESESDTQFHRLVGSSLSAIIANTHLSGFLSKSAHEIRKIIQYDRVMIYKFHPDGHGEVVAEDKAESLSPFLGLHYPASDIPKQVRALYILNHVRLIADVNKKPADLITNIQHGPLDLSNAVLRAVSPVHIQCLKNMGVESSFSISLMHRGKLWGLIACHNISPRFINYKGREAATFIGEILSCTLGYQQQEEDQQKKHRFKVAVETLAKQLFKSDTVQNALFDHEVTLLNAVNATGALLVLDNEIKTCGETPDKPFLDLLIQWLNENVLDQSYITNQLPHEFPTALKEKRLCSGILVLRLSKNVNDYLIWMRPEVIFNVTWGGNTDKPVEFNKNQEMKLSPRKSFEAWSQSVLNNSEVWNNEDVSSALHLREEVASSLIRKAAEVRKANEKLNKAYKTLDAFSYTISHDLKTPLTIINAYAQMLYEDFGSDPAAKSMISGILSSTQKMGVMIKRILHYSQIGQSEVELVQVNMKKLLEEIRDGLLLINTHPSMQVIFKNTPDIYADETMTMQVFSNLLANAMKYSSKSENPVIIIDARDTGSHIEYQISDNGIGIKLSDQEKIYELFTRSGDVAEYEGSGVGLSIARRIMEKHEGKIRVESDGKSGSTFSVSFQKPEEDVLP